MLHLLSSFSETGYGPRPSHIQVNGKNSIAFGSTGQSPLDLTLASPYAGKTSTIFLVIILHMKALGELNLQSTYQ